MRKRERGKDEPCAGDWIMPRALQPSLPEPSRPSGKPRPTTSMSHRISELTGVSVLREWCAVPQHSQARAVQRRSALRPPHSCMTKNGMRRRSDKYLYVVPRSIPITGDVILAETSVSALKIDQRRKCPYCEYFRRVGACT